MKKKIRLNVLIGMKQMVFTSSSPLDEFYHETVVCDKENTAIMHVNPLQVLLNQKRLDKLGSMGLDQWLTQFDLQKSSALDKLRSQCSDEDLLSTLKSRHLQSPAEILAWSRYMSENLDTFHSEVKNFIKAQQDAASAQTDSLQNDDSKTQ